MTTYSIQPGDWIFVKGHGFLSFAKNIGKSIGKNISKNLSSRYSQKPIMLSNLLQIRLKMLQKEQFKKTADATGDLIGNKIANRITKVSKHSQQNNSETVTNENDKKILKERYVLPEEKQNIIDDLRLK